MDLGYGRGSERMMVDGREHRREGPAELLDQDSFDDGPRFGPDPVPAPLELRHELRGEDAVTRSNDLTELDIGRPQLLGRYAESTGYPRNLL